MSKELGVAEADIIAANKYCIFAFFLVSPESLNNYMTQIGEGALPQYQMPLIVEFFGSLENES